MSQATKEATYRGVGNSVSAAWRAVRAWLRTDAAPRWIIVGLLVAGALLRLTNLNWDKFTHIHPDERFLTMVTSAMQLPELSLGEFFDSTKSQMNPYNIGYDFFVYGTLPLFIVRVVAEIVQKINEFAHIWLQPGSGGPLINLTGYDGVHLVGRFLSGLFDLGVVWLIYLIGRRLYSVRVALLAAAFYAFAVLALQQSHFYTVDTFGTFFAVLTFYFAVRVAQGANPERRSGWAAYVALGPASARRWPAASTWRRWPGSRCWARASVRGTSLRRRAPRATAAWRPAWTSNMIQATLFRLVLMGVVT